MYGIIYYNATGSFPCLIVYEIYINSTQIVYVYLHLSCQRDIERMHVWFGLGYKLKKWQI